MTLKEVANTDVTIAAKEASTSATFAITSAPKTKVKAEGKPVYAGGITVSITAATNGTCTQTGGPVTGTITPDATKSRAEGALVNRVDDEGTQLSIPGLTGGGAGCTVLLTPIVDDAGQTKVKAQ
jgi:hypothetical protein